MSLENFENEISEIFRVHIRAIKIHAYLWIYSFNALHFWNREKICYKFHVYSFHFWWEMSKLQLVWLEVEDEVFRTCFSLHIYCFVCINGCIATPVVEARACNLWDLGSSPSGTLFIFHIFIFWFLLFLEGDGPLWAWLVFVFASWPPYWLMAPLAQVFFVFLFISFS